MAATLETGRYIDRKQHDCGCITVWDNLGGGARYEHACGLHRRYAHHWPASNA